MKRKAQGRRGPEQMKKLRLSVQEFVEKSGGNAPVPEPGSEGPPGGRVKSRKELRKEKRKSKKMRKKQYYERRHLGTPGEQVSAEGVKPADPKKEQPKEDKKVTKEVKKPQPVQKEPKKKKISKEELRRKALLEANEKEEKEIKRLEKSLRMNKRKNKSTLPQSFTQDGLDYILGALEPGGSVSGLYEEEDEEANTADKIHKLSENAYDGDSAEDDDNDDEIIQGLEGGESSEDNGSMAIESGEEEEDMNQESDGEAKEEENEGSDEDPDITQGSDGEQETQKSAEGAGNKYVPPHLRQSSESMDAKRKEELERLKKSVKGLMNRLSEPNMASICGQMEELYMANSRKDMNETLTDVLLNACITPARMPDRLMMEHVLLVSVLHHTVGIEVGAHVLESVVKRFDELYQENTEGKECDNLISFVGHLYNFHVIGSGLVFDLLKKFVVAFTERDVDWVLLLLKNVGFSLRKDDALALKELISEAQTKANDASKKFQDQTRARFLLDTMLALKNNDMRKIPGYDPEPVEKLRKLMRSLVHSSASGSDPRLRVSLDNILDADKVGRWWIVGSSWSGAPMIGSSAAKPQQLPIGKVSAKIMELARKQRMNTDIRRNIFCVLMTSEDYLDAFEKLLKLGLKDHQEREIVHVLIDCCLQEKVFNPFYAFLSSKFCEYDRRFQMTFQFSMWDKFKDLESLSATTFANLVNLLSHLIKSKSLPLSVFKVIEFSELDKIRVSFLRLILYKLLMETEEEDLAQIFGKASENTKLGMLREGLKLFITHFLLKNIRAQKSAEEADLLSQRADLAVKALQAKENKLRL
ncbi:nucleolar MIF4G domain-containing protein 1 [Spea bombifrons]|uniref:nucleolar MIF4G domain-containing protein 1 n=1 Tax=Spea bombifrons TaxID=233779 RepID=UPI00234A4797|nr:nucleolar MIF4G domain-containing protein 1 [Spea bombifrons]